MWHGAAACECAGEGRGKGEASGRGDSHNDDDAQRQRGGGAGDRPAGTPSNRRSRVAGLQMRPRSMTAQIHGVGGLCMSTDSFCVPAIAR